MKQHGTKRRSCGKVPKCDHLLAGQFRIGESPCSVKEEPSLPNGGTAVEGGWFANIKKLVNGLEVFDYSLEYWYTRQATCARQLHEPN